MVPLYKVQGEAKLMYHVRSQDGGSLGEGTKHWKEKTRGFRGFWLCDFGLLIYDVYLVKIFFSCMLIYAVY